MIKLIYHLNSTDYENVLKNYQKNVYQIQTQKVDMRLQNLTEDAINNYNNMKNQQKIALFIEYIILIYFRNFNIIIFYILYETIS